MDLYQAKRMPRTADLINLNRRLAGLTMSRSRIVCGIRNAVLPMVLGGPAMRTHRRNMKPAV
jgi:hypothetical protein